MENKIDIQFLKRPLIFFAISLVLSLVFIVLGWQFQNSKNAEYIQAKSSLSSSHRVYKQLVEDLDLLDQYKKAYKEYKKTGLIGPERRLSWIETLEAVNDVLKLPRLTYALQPQQEFSRPGLKVERNIVIGSTPMDLTIDLLHEEDLFAVFEGIAGNINNLFSIDSCRITRMGKGDSVLSTKSANLTSKCLMRWITVDVQNK